MTTSGELRCPNHQLFGRIEDGKLEVVCRNRLCGYGPGVVVRHYFDSETGEFLETKKYKDPQQLFQQKSSKKERANNATH